MKADDAIARATELLDRGAGPDRVLLNINGEAVSAAEAAERGVYPACVLVRNDGWTLGATRPLYEAAKQLWYREWVAVVCYAHSPHRVVVKFPPPLGAA